MEFHLDKMQIAGSAILFHYFLAAVQCCCGNILLPSSSFSHSIIATLWQLQVLFITNCNGQFFLPHYFFAAVHRCCGNIFLPSSSFSHSIIATSGNYKFYLSQTAMDSFFTALFLRRGPSLLWRYHFIISSPLSIAVRPVFTYSRIPKGSRSFIRLSIFSSLPVASTTTLSGATSIIWAR